MLGVPLYPEYIMAWLLFLPYLIWRICPPEQLDLDGVFDILQASISVILLYGVIGILLLYLFLPTCSRARIGDIDPGPLPVSCISAALAMHLATGYFLRPPENTRKQLAIAGFLWGAFPWFPYLASCIMYPNPLDIP